VVDLLSRRRDVDKRRIAIVGWSFCGGSVARAAAFDHRLAAVVVDPGVNNVLAAYNLGKLLTLADEGEKQRVNEIWAQTLKRFTPQIRFTVAKRSEIFAKPDFYDQIRFMQLFNLDPATIARIKSPTMVMKAQGEQFYPGQSDEVYRALRAPKKLQLFTAAQGAQFHDEPMAPQTRNEALYDWLDATLHV
jgi:cephalosporin-C deacetylase-like acetyl esterase